MNLSTEKEIMDLENRLVVARGEGEGVGWIGKLGLMDANYCSWNGFTMRSCCVALKTISRYLQRSMTPEKKLCIHVYVTGSPRCTVGKKKYVEVKNNKKRKYYLYWKQQCHTPH